MKNIGSPYVQHGVKEAAVRPPNGLYNFGESLEVSVSYSSIILHFYYTKIQKIMSHLSVEDARITLLSHSTPRRSSTNRREGER